MVGELKVTAVKEDTKMFATKCSKVIVSWCCEPIYIGARYGETEGSEALSLI